MTSGTEVGITLAELISVAVAIVGAIWLIGMMAARQFMVNLGEKFAASKTRIDTLETAISEKFRVSDSRIDDRFQTIDSKLKTFDPLHGELARVDKDLVQVRLEMSQQYVRQEGLRILTARMEALFKEVFDKLDSKADKSTCVAEHRG